MKILIKMLKTATGPHFSMQADKEYPVDKKVAESLINARAATLVKVITPPEQVELEQVEPEQVEPEQVEPKPASKAPAKIRPSRI